MYENEIESLKAEIAAKDAIIQEMKTAADAQHAEAEKLGKLAEEAAQAGQQAAEALEQAKKEFAEQLAGKDAVLADWERRYTEMRGEFEARNAERDTQAANLRAELEAAHATVTANLKARIAELEANAKTAEQIAAEKYGAAIAPIAATPAGGKSLKERIEEARGNNGAMSEIARTHTREEILAAMK